MPRAKKKLSEMHVRRTIGRNVAELRTTETALNQKQLSVRCGFHWTYIGRLERAEVNTTIGSLVRVANEFGVDLEDLLAERE
jgi:transcriptional regulator with XRE-family HTH domain